MRRLHGVRGLPSVVGRGTSIAVGSRRPFGEELCPAAPSSYGFGACEVCTGSVGTTNCSGESDRYRRMSTAVEFRVGRDEVRDVEHFRTDNIGNEAARFAEREFDEAGCDVINMYRLEPESGRGRRHGQSGQSFHDGENKLVELRRAQYRPRHAGTGNFLLGGVFRAEIPDRHRSGADDRDHDDMIDTCRCGRRRDIARGDVVTFGAAGKMKHGADALVGRV